MRGRRPEEGGGERVECEGEGNCEISKHPEPLYCKKSIGKAQQPSN